MLASIGHVEVVRLLLSRGANINAVDLYRWSAIAIAADGYDDIPFQYTTTYPFNTPCRHNYTLSTHDGSIHSAINIV